MASVDKAIVHEYWLRKLAGVRYNNELGIASPGATRHFQYRLQSNEIDSLKVVSVFCILLRLYFPALVKIIVAIDPSVISEGKAGKTLYISLPPANVDVTKFIKGIEREISTAIKHSDYIVDRLRDDLVELNTDLEELSSFSIENNREFIFSLGGAFMFSEQQFFFDFQRLTSSVDVYKSNTVDEIDIVEEKVKYQLLNVPASNNSRAHSGICYEFDAIAGSLPNKIAITYAGRSLTYRQLKDRSILLANHLSTIYGVAQNDRVVVYADKSDWLVVCFLAILRAGGTYVPVATEIPHERLEYIVRETNAKLVLCPSTSIHDKIPAPFLDPSSLQPSFEQHPPSAIITKPAENAYIIFTSGSTGKPKGVVVSTGGVLNMADEQIRQFGVCPDDNILLFASIGFDASVSELLMTLLSGASLVIPGITDNSSLQRLTTFIKDLNVTVATFPPSLLSMLEPLELGSLRVIISAGEQFRPSTVKFHRHVHLFNAYGPTECSVCATIYKVSASDEAYSLIPIGKPIKGTGVVILNSRLQLVPTGVEGQVGIIGAGLATGYLNDPVLTEKCFVTSSFLGDQRIYLTGDRGRMLEDGNIQFLGRIDEQVKLRGYRIEPTEVHKWLLCHPSVKDAAIEVRGQYEDAVLIAYVVSNSVDEVEVSTYLRQHLPSYMIPSRIVSLKSLPLNLNGKFDSSGISLQSLSSPTATDKLDELEVELLNSWRSLLRDPSLTVDSNFFSFGGSSLKALKVLNDISRRLSIDLGLDDLFVNPTIRQLSSHIKASGHNDLRGQIEAAPVQPYYALSFTQHQLWTLCNIAETSIAYNIPLSLVLQNHVNAEVLEESINYLISRHEALRTVFKVVENNPVQFVLPSDDVSFKISKNNAFSFTEPGDVKLTNYIDQRSNILFNLERWPLFEVELIPISGGKTVVFLNFHHIIFDEVTAPLFFQQLEYVYGLFVDGAKPVAGPLKLQPKDHSVWQHRNRSTQGYNDSKAYWQSLFRKGLPLLDLPRDYQRSRLVHGRVGIVEKEIAPGTWAKIESGSSTLGASQFAYALSCLFVVLQRFTSKTNFAVFTPFSGRNRPELEDVFGYFVNTLPIVQDVDSHSKFAGLVNAISSKVADAHRHQNVSITDVLSDFTSKSATNVAAGREVLFAMQEGENVSSQLKLFRPHYIRAHPTLAKFQLMFLVEKRWDAYCLKIEYDSGLFSGESIQALANFYLSVLSDERWTTNTLIRDIARVKPKIFKQEIVDNETVTELFNKMVKAQPSKIAIRHNGTEITYAELDRQSTIIARRLVNVGVSNGSIVGTCFDRSYFNILAQLAVLKSGAAYLPASKADITQRTLQIFKSNCKIVLCASDLRSYFELHQVPVLPFDHPVDSDPGSDVILPSINGNDLAYVMFTSGSTGLPKGVSIRHSSICNLVHKCQEVSFSENDVVGSAADVGFDASTFEVWGPLCNGGTVEVIDRDILLNPRELERLLKTNRVTILFLTTSLANQLIESSDSIFDQLGILVIGGENLNVEKIRKLATGRRPRRIVNGYGPTEATTFTTYYDIDVPAANLVGIPIGKPLRNVHIVIANEGQVLVPQGAIGEILIGGAGLCEGYLNEQAETSDKFISIDGCKFYRSGDFGRFCDSENIQYLGRIDRQIKMNGYRIELSEIESKLSMYESILDVTVMQFDHNAHVILVAFVVPGNSFNNENCTAWISANLPFYMAPARIITLASLPLLSSGKIDAEALKAIFRSYQTEFSPGIQQKRDEFEEKIFRIWQVIFVTDQIDINSNFFEIGGNSIAVVKLFQELQLEFPDVFLINDLFSMPTIMLQARFARTKQATAIPVMNLIDEIKL